MLYTSIEELIGNTPLLKIDPSIHGLSQIDLYAKLEFFNPFGSVKDRIAKTMLESHWKELSDNHQVVIESSSGNTGKAIAALCSIHGIPFRSITNRIKIPEQRMMMQVLGALIQELPGFSECPDPSDPNNAISMSEQLVATNPDQYYYPNQYYSELNVRAHEQTGREINDDLEKTDYLIGVLGTTGSTVGAGKAIREKNPDTKIIGIVAEAHNHIPGGREAQEMWEVGLFDKSMYEEILPVSVAQAIDGMMTLVRRCGILCGPTTGANYAAGLQYLREEDKKLISTGKRKNAVIIACDRIEPYMSYLKKHRPEIFSTSTSKALLVSQIDADAVQGTKVVDSQALQGSNKENLTIVDLRGNFAYAIGHIPGSMNIPADVCSQLVEQGTIFPKGMRIVFVCRVGDLSKRYAAYLEQQGYDSVSLTGGIAEWKAQGFQLERNA